MNFLESSVLALWVASLIGALVLGQFWRRQVDAAERAENRERRYEHVNDRVLADNGNLTRRIEKVESMLNQAMPKGER